MKSNSNYMKLYLGLFLILCVVTFSVFLAAPSIQGQKEKNEEATVVQKGKVTDKEKEYSKEYRKLYPDRAGKKLSDVSLLASQKGWNKEIGVYVGLPDVPGMASEKEKTFQELIKEWTCKADLVVVGSVVEKKAHMLDDETFVYTEYSLRVSEIAKNNSTFPIEIGRTIEVTRPGGFIKLDNQLIKVEDMSYKPLSIKKTYLLFLRYVPAAKGYMAFNGEEDFLIEGNNITNLSSKALPKTFEDQDTLSTVVAEILSAGKTDCANVIEEN